MHALGALRGSGPPHRPDHTVAWGAAPLGVVISLLNVAYCKGYTQSADARIKPFRRRTALFRAVFYGFAAGLAASAASAAGVL